MSHVFISYSHLDGDFMQSIKQRLSEEDIPVWTDEKLSWGTPSWMKSVEKAIRGASAVVVLLSPRSNESTWVAREIAMAEMLSISIYPILIDGEERDSVPLQLINHQRIRYDDPNFDRQLRQLKANLRRSLTQASTQSAQEAPSESRDALKQYAQQLKSSRAELRLDGVQGLVRLNVKRAVPHLIEALENETRSTRVRIQLIQALGIYKDERAIQVLASQLEDKRRLKYTATVRANAIRALKIIGTPEALAALPPDA